MLKFLFVLLSFAAASSVYADGVSSLRDFVRATQSAKASFQQTVLDKSGHATQKATGTMEFARPGKFRWVYNKPYEQVIVGDGTKLWVYDVDLNQVTVKKLDQAIGSSPAALLAGNNDIDRIFTLKDMPDRKDGLEWLEATPKGKETSFEKVQMGFQGGELREMILRDSFGQTTDIRFSDVQRNPGLPADTFKFVPPKGADVIGDE